eukprot:GFUD01036812.1.p1 GENE.GFUD01036812.1~~GFUD01036812.1.p1  ORF type:complete len:203 (+),score=39.63 GFUD01036812.1:44-652(+)
MSIVDQMATLHIRGKHNNTTYDIKFPEEATIQDLGEKVHELTGVPISGQKLICCGKQLPKDLKVTLKEAGFKTGIGSKLMILGKKYDPENEDDYKQIVELENKSKNIEHKVDEVLTEIDGICKGHLDKSLHAEACKSLQKRVKSTNEELQKLLETLDGFSLNEDQQECKIKRKSVATKMNKLMDRNDANLEKIKQFLEHGFP